MIRVSQAAAKVHTRVQPLEEFSRTYHGGFMVFKLQKKISRRLTPFLYLFYARISKYAKIVIPQWFFESTPKQAKKSAAGWSASELDVRKSNNQTQVGAQGN